MSIVGLLSIVVIVLAIFEDVSACNQPGWQGKMDSLIKRASQRVNVVLDKRIKDAMGLVDRACFVPVQYKSAAYDDNPLQIPSGIRATISAPHMHVKALQELSPYMNEGSCVLDVGSGSGYLTAVISQLIGEEGVTMGVDYQSVLVEWSKQNVERWTKDTMTDHDNIHLETVNIFDFDKNDYAYLNGRCFDGFDAIHVGATADEKILDKLEKLMTPSSRLVIPLKEEGMEWFYRIDKNEYGQIGEKVKLLSVRYVPLVESDQEEGDNRNLQHDGL